MNAVSTVKTLFLNNERVSMLSLGGMMALAVVFMVLISLTTLNDKAMKGYRVNSLEEDRQELVTDGEVTDMMILYATSMSHMEERAAQLNMRKPATEDIAYVLPVTVVAQK